MLSFFFQAEDGIRDRDVTGVQTCALPIWQGPADASRVTFRFIPEFSARLAALLSGEIDIMKDVPPHAVEALERSGRAKVRSTVSSRINYLALQALKPGPMQDLRVRRAMNHAIDGDARSRDVLQGRATRMWRP